MRGWAGLALAGVCLIAGCDNFWDKPANSGGGNTNASGVFYVLDQQTNQVAGFSIPSGSKTPSAVSGSPYNLGFTPFCETISPNGNYLYVGSETGVFVYSIGSGGALTLLNNSQPITSADLPTTMAVDSTGTWILLGTSGTNTVHALPISTTTGLLDSTRTEQSANLPASTVAKIAVTPSGAATSYVFLAMGTNGTFVLPFNSSATNPFSTYTAYKVKNTGGSDTTIGVDPSDRLLYVGETLALSGRQTGGLRVYTIGANSSITEVSGSPYGTAGTGPSAIVATANFVYVANRSVSGSANGNITGYPVSSVGSSTSLGTLINTVSAGILTSGLAMESSNTYLLAVNTGGSADLSTYTFDTTGKLTAGATAATGTDPVQAIAIAAVP